MILVTGGAGFIGSHTVDRLVALGRDVRVLDDLSSGRAERLPAGVDLQVGCVTDPEAVAAAMDGVDAVLHLAAMVSVPASFDDPARCHDHNTGGLLQILRAATTAGVRRVAYASSCAVYGSLPGLPKREDGPVQPESPYAATKLANEAYASAWAREGLTTVGLRYFNVFGPRQDPSGPYGAVIPVFVQRALAGQPLGVHGDGQQGRDFVSVLDVAAANVAALDAEVERAEVVNVGTGDMLTIAELAGRVRSLVADVPVVHGPARVGDVRESCADVSRASARLGWSASEDFGAALDATIAWFRDGCPDG